MPQMPTIDLVRIIEYFDASAFAYLALEVNGERLCIERPARVPAIPVTATTVGTVYPCTPDGAFPRSGDRVTRGQPLFALRRFRSVVDVPAPCDGRLEAIHVNAGQFVQYGDALASIACD